MAGVMSVPNQAHEELRLMRGLMLGDGCWEWIGKRRPDGYGSLRVLGRDTRTHRFSYETFVGPIPKGLVIDHLCENKACARPDHLEPVTIAENTRRHFRGVRSRNQKDS